MSGSVALKISKKMNTEFSNVKRGLVSSGEAVSSFAGYLEALKDITAISEDEESAFLRELVKALIA